MKQLQKINGLSSRIVIIILIIIGFIVYGNTFVNEMVWDDYESIINNKYVHNWEHVPKYFSENLTAGSGISNNYWRPLLLLTFSIDYQIAKLNPFVYHLQNIIWHILASVLVFILFIL